MVGEARLLLRRGTRLLDLLLDHPLDITALITSE
jgi:hypothetical protein